MKMKLGTRVICKGYLKRIPFKYVVAEDGFDDYIAKTYPGDVKPGAVKPDDVMNVKILKSEDEELEQKTKETILCKYFKGIVVAFKNVSTSNWYDFPDIATWCGGGETDYTRIKVSKGEYIPCYQVFYALGKSRLIPIELVEEDKQCLI